MILPDRELILPAAAPRVGFSARLAAAAAAGISEIGISMRQYQDAIDAGRAGEELVAEAARYGIRVSEVEVLYGALGRDEDGRVAAFAERLFAMADLFGARRLICSGVVEGGLDAGAERFARLCDRAGEHGLVAALEFIPWTDIPDLRTAWEIVRRAGRANGGIVLDTWHFFRGDPDFSVIAEIPPEAFALLQLDDGPEPVPDIDPYEETTRYRKFPGEGTFDLVGLVRTLDRCGVRAPVAPEVISDELRAMAPAAAARRMVETTVAVFAQARASAGERDAER